MTIKCVAASLCLLPEDQSSQLPVYLISNPMNFPFTPYQHHITKYFIARKNTLFTHQPKPQRTQNIWTMKT